MAERIPLAVAIEGLRAELEVAAEEGKGKEIGFEATSVEVTLETAVTTAGEGHAGVKWWLVEAGGKVSRESGATQSVTITLTPRRRGPDGSRGPVDLEGTM